MSIIEPIPLIPSRRQDIPRWRVSRRTHRIRESAFRVHAAWSRRLHHSMSKRTDPNAPIRSAETTCTFSSRRDSMSFSESILRDISILHRGAGAPRASANVAEPYGMVHIMQLPRAGGEEPGNPPCRAYRWSARPWRPRHV